MNTNVSRKVLCIDTKPIKGCPEKKLNHLKEGEVYTVKSQYVDYAGDLGYHLHEINLKGPAGYMACRFIPLSDIDESTFINQTDVLKN